MAQAGVGAGSAVERSLGELAALVEGEVVGDPELPIRGVRALEDAGPEELSLLTDPRYREAALASAAGALLVRGGPEGPHGAEGLGKPLLVVADPPWALARLLALFHPEATLPAGAHSTAVVDPEAEVDPSAHVGPFAVVGAGSRVEAGAAIEAHAVVGRGCRVGEGSHLHPHVVVYDGTEIGCRVEVHSGSVLGADGFGYATRDGVHHKVPQVGRVVVEDDVEIGACTTVDRATLGTTRVGAGSKVDNQVQVGHNVEIGAGSILCGQAAVAGSSRLGAGVVLAGRAGVGDHLTVGDGVQVAACGVALTPIEAGQKVAGVPAIPLREWRRQVVLLPRLREMMQRLRAIERRLTGNREEESE